MASFCTPHDRMEVGRVVLNPEVVFIRPPVKMDFDLVHENVADGSHPNKNGVPLDNNLELHALSEQGDVAFGWLEGPVWNGFTASFF